MRSRQVFDIIAGVFGASNRHRLVHVLSTWAFLCNPDNRGCGYPYTQEILSWNDTYKHVDALGLTAYFCDSLGQSSRFAAASTMTPAQMLADCRSELAAANASTRRLVAIAQAYNLSTVTYESGPSLMESSAISSGRFTRELCCCPLYSHESHPLF
jgi:hypothetical protein